MCQNDRNDTRTSSGSSREPEKNPFVAFRHHVDQQINSLFGSLLTLPSTIYNQGAQHGREWSQRRSDGSKEDAAASRASRAVDLSKEWEQAMKDFEDNEREAKEWYDTVLQQITARRDAHLESGLGFDDKETKAAERDTETATEELSCPYLPPKEQRVGPAPQVPKQEDRPWCRREHPHSRFFDWVWSGWGGPSTTPNMLWHQERQAQEQGQTEDVKAAPVTTSPAPVVMTHDAGNEEDEYPATYNPFSLARWLVFNSYSPIQLEDHPELGADGRAWRSAYEDLLRAHLDEPPMTPMEEVETESVHPALWMARMTELHTMSGVSEEDRDKYKSLKRQIPSLLRAFAEQMDLPMAYTQPPPHEMIQDFARRQTERTGTPGPNDSVSWEDLVRGLAREVEPTPDPGTELDAYMEQCMNNSTTEPRTAPFPMQSTAPTNNPRDGKPGILSMLIKIERVVNVDGTVTEKTVWKESFANGRNRTTERVKTMDKDGMTKSETTSTAEAPQQHPYQYPSPWHPPEFVPFYVRDGLPVPVDQEQSGTFGGEVPRTQRPDQWTPKEKRDEKKNSGWFWRN